MNPQPVYVLIGWLIGFFSAGIEYFYGITYPYEKLGPKWKEKILIAIVAIAGGMTSVHLILPGFTRNTIFGMILEVTILFLIPILIVRAKKKGRKNPPE